MAAPLFAPSAPADVVVMGARASQQSSMDRKRNVATPVAAPPDTEAYPNASANPIKQTATEPVSTFSIDVDTAAYANVRRFLKNGRLPPSDAVRIEELLNYFDYGYAAPASASTPFRPHVAVAPSPWAPGKQLVHIGVQGYKPAAAARPPLNLVFLVDTSGSMWSEDRLPLAQKAMNILIDQLGDRDRVAIVAYADSVGAVLAPTTGREKLKMRCALDALRAGGSTAGGQGLALAYALAQLNFDKDAVNRIVLMTDGDFNVGVTNNQRLEDFVADKRKTGIYLSVYGFGRGNYQDERMQTLAQNGNGTAAYIDTLDEARKLFRDDFSSNMVPIADDVKIQVEFNPAAVAEYRLLGYETRMLNREDFNNDAVDAGEVGAGASVTALYEITPVGGPLSSDPLRYAAPARPATGPAPNELAFLKIRYKAPGGDTSRLIETPILRSSAVSNIAAAPEATRWAAAVAAYGLKLRRDPFVPESYDWDQVLALAQGARGADEFGLRAEFVGLVRNAKDAKP
jgi:Ca-activated chloride channel family protein